MAFMFDTGREMREVPRKKWPLFSQLETEALRVWLSNDYMAVLYRQRINGDVRLTANRTRRNGRDFRDGITWDELQRVKNECLGEDAWCYEVYPSEDKLVNVHNQRHLWVLDVPPEKRFPEEAYVSDGDAKAAMAILKAMIGR